MENGMGAVFQEGVKKAADYLEPLVQIKIQLYTDLQQARILNQDSRCLSVLPNYERDLEDIRIISLRKLSIESQKVLNVTAFLNPDEVQQNLLHKAGQ